MNFEELKEEELNSIRRAFTVFIVKVIKHSSIDFARKERNRLSRIVSLSEYTNNEMSLSLFDDDIFSCQECNNYKNLHKIMSKSNYQDAIINLTEREKQIIYFLYIKEMEMSDVAKRLNLTIKTVRNTKNNALNKLRNDMEV